MGAGFFDPFFLAPLSTSWSFGPWLAGLGRAAPLMGNLCGSSGSSSWLDDGVGNAVIVFCFFLGVSMTTDTLPLACSTSEELHSSNTLGEGSFQRFRFASLATSSQSPLIIRSKEFSNSLPVGGSLLIHMVTPFRRPLITWQRLFTRRRTPGIFMLVPTTINASGRERMSAFITDVIASSSGLCSL